MTGPAVKVETADGALEGRREGELAVFRGISYARPPVGEPRFGTPEPPNAAPACERRRRSGLPRRRSSTGWCRSSGSSESTS